VSDYLGSARVTLSTSAEPLQSSSYHPYGTERTSSGSGARTSYIGREHDNESDLGFYGVRLYEPEYGRFLSTDVLWGKYLPLQPYQYAGNEPVTLLDDGGKWVQAADTKAQEAVRNSVPERFRDFVVFNDGILDVGRIKEGAQGQDANSNVAILSRLAENESTIEVKVTDEFNAMTNSGRIVETSFSQFDEPTKGGGMEHTLGLTLPPRSDQERSGFSAGLPFSTSGNVQVLVRASNPTQKSIGSTAAHELFGHARFILLCRLGKATVARHSKADEPTNDVDKAANKAQVEADEK
jgi:RHS repeat-associated protein